MNMKGRRNFLVNIAFWAVIVALVYLIFKYLIHLIMPFFLALIFAALMRPVVRLLVEKLRFPKGVAGVVVSVLFFAVIGTLIALLTLRIISGLGDIFALLPDLYRDSIEPGLVDLFNRIQAFAARYDMNVEETLESIGPQILSAAGNAVSSISGRVVGWVSSLVTKVPRFLVGLIICVVATFFMSADYDRMMNVLLHLFPEKAQAVLLDVRRSLVKIMKQYGRSYILILGITFAELTLGLLLLGVKRFLLIALLIAILDIFPVLGTGTVLIPWAIIALIQGHVGRGIGLLVVYAVITIIRQVIEPRIVGKHVGLHPLITLICMFVGTSLFNVVGLFGLPILMAILLELHNSGTLRVFRTMGEEESVQAQPLDGRAAPKPPAGDSGSRAPAPKTPAPRTPPPKASGSKMLKKKRR